MSATRWTRTLVDSCVAAAIVLVVSLLARQAGLNVPTVVLVLHTVVVILAALRHLAAGITAALAATLSLSFFLHPSDTWRIDDPANWLALVSFLVASMVVGRLLILARDEAVRAESHRRQVTTLYRLGVDLLAASEGQDAVASAIDLAQRAVDGSSGGVVRRVGASAEPLVWRGDPAGYELIAAYTECLTAGTGRSLSIGGRRCVITPIDEVEVLVLVSGETSTSAIESVSALVALTLRHQRAVVRAARVDALRESELVRTSLIRAVSHDLNTPLTALILELDALERELDDPAATRKRLDALREDAASLRHRIDSLLAMARIEAGTYRPSLEPVSAAELFGAAARHLSIISDSRQLVVEIADDCPDLLVDPTLVTEILTNLIDNAHRATPPGGAIRLTARRSERERVQLEVFDPGPGFAIDDPRWSRGVAIPVDELPRRGLGLEIARTFARLHDGTVTIRNDAGTIATIDLAASNEDSTDDA